MYLSKHIYNSGEAKGWLPWIVLAPFLGMLFVIGSVLPVDLALGQFGLTEEDGSFNSITGFILFLILPFSIMFFIVILWTLKVEKRSLQTIGVFWPTAAKVFPRYVMVGVLTSATVVLLISLAGGYEIGAWLPAFESLSELGLILLLLGGFAIQSSAEELLFRGWLLSTVSRKSNLLVGMLVSSALFTLLHFDPRVAWYVAVGSFLFSIFACYLVLVTGNIWSAMGWHVGWNWFIGVGFEIPITGIKIDVSALIVQLSPNQQTWLNGGNGGPENGVFCLLVLTLGILICQRSLSKRASSLRPTDDA
ncbi:type II CAAX endopeptidase family protein [Aliiglaciecola sp. LCG003]|uniref:CPBP family intramembrane glutamic endopeptidase n=1 Tax=Aliiglaciecola sp. LCG003 TaxID=3053655 RepID=UPI00257396D5|nr:type II CAAX endopeptidase family protein [Aliiglaciecola sp. LCG003]WJG09410.1 type II CAAX endopeptidase family protein [Aliiglaciecola sp. LCG003]